MYIYHALINALSAHMIHINLNMIFYTHVEHRILYFICIIYIILKDISVRSNWICVTASSCYSTKTKFIKHDYTTNRHYNHE